MQINYNQHSIESSAFVTNLLTYFSSFPKVSLHLHHISFQRISLIQFTTTTAVNLHYPPVSDLIIFHVPSKHPRNSAQSGHDSTTCLPLFAFMYVQILMNSRLHPSIRSSNALRIQIHGNSRIIVNCTRIPTPPSFALLLLVLVSLNGFLFVLVQYPPPWYLHPFLVKHVDGWMLKCAPLHFCAESALCASAVPSSLPPHTSTVCKFYIMEACESRIRSRRG